MKKQEEKRLFPEEFAHVEQWVRDAQKEILRMETEIQKLSGQTWKRPVPAPKGMQVDSEQYRKDIIGSYEKQIGTIGKETIEKIKPHLADTNLRLGRKVIEKTMHLLDRKNNLKDASGEKMETEKQAEKDIDRSSNFANTLYMDSAAYFDSYTGRSGFAQALREAEKSDPVSHFPSNKKDITGKGMDD